MNDLEAATVFGLLTAAWPDKQLPDETIDLWLEMAANVDAADAEDAARQIIREDQWFPSVARFLQMAEAKAHARRNRNADTRGISTGHRAAPPPKQLLDAARHLIKEQGTKRHDHSGPAPCPVCGGIAPPSSKKKPNVATRTAPKMTGYKPQTSAVPGYGDIYGDRT